MNAGLAGSGLNLRVDLTVATRRSQAQAAVSRFIAENNPEITITHSIGDGDVVNHGAADLVYRAWQDAAKGARLGNSGSACRTIALDDVGTVLSGGSSNPRARATTSWSPTGRTAATPRLCFEPGIPFATNRAAGSRW